MSVEPFRPLRDEIRTAIRDRIVTGQYGPGDRLVERTIAADLGVSRVPVREALHTLVREGFAVDRATRGIAVRAYDADEIAEIAAVGAALERVLVRRLAAARAGDSTATPALDRLTPLRTVLDSAHDALASGDLDAAVGANARFHEVLESLGSGSIVGEVLGVVGDRRRWLLRQHTDPAPIHAEHVALYDALLAGDADRAAAVVEAHAATSVAHAVSTASGSSR